jgi:hypothetical protein
LGCAIPGTAQGLARWKNNSFVSGHGFSVPQVIENMSGLYPRRMVSLPNSEFFRSLFTPNQPAAPEKHAILSSNVALICFHCFIRFHPIKIPQVTHFAIEIASYAIMGRSRSLYWTLF